MSNKINETILIADKAYKNKNYLKSYSLYKAIYKKYELSEIIPRLADIAFLTLKQTNIKLALITNIINIGLKNILLNFQLSYIFLIKIIEGIQKIFTI